MRVVLATALVALALTASPAQTQTADPCGPPAAIGVGNDGPATKQPREPRAREPSSKPIDAQPGIGRGVAP